MARKLSKPKARLESMDEQKGRARLSALEAKPSRTLAESAEMIELSSQSLQEESEGSSDPVTRACISLSASLARLAATVMEMEETPGPAQLAVEKRPALRLVK